MPQAQVREGKRYRYFRETGTRVTRTRHGGEVEHIVGDWVYAEAGEVIDVTTGALRGAADFLAPVGVVDPIGEQDEPYADTEAVLDGGWQAVVKAVSEIDDPELLDVLREAESKSRNRGSVLKAIDAALAEVDEDNDDDE